MLGDGEEEWGSDAKATRWDPLQLLSLRWQGMAEPSSESPLLSPGTASTVPRYVGWFGEGREDRAALARRKRMCGLGGSTARCCWCGTIVSACRRVAGGGRRPRHFTAVLASASCHQPGFSWDPAPLLTQGVQAPCRHRRPPSPSFVQTPAGSGIAPCMEYMLVLRMDAGITFVLRGFKG